jgi:hypothetical protein
VEQAKINAAVKFKANRPLSKHAGLSRSLQHGSIIIITLASFMIIVLVAFHTS